MFPYELYARYQKFSFCGLKWVLTLSIYYNNFDNDVQWSFLNKVKKNTSTGPVNCKKTTRHQAHLSLCGKSRKTNNAKSRKWPKTSCWPIFWRFWGQISRNCRFFWKIGFIQNWRSYLVLNSDQKPKTSLEQFLKKISKCLILG